MRLVTYDRAGARRLGAWVEDDILVDLPEAVGHPAFPTTMESLVARSGGSILDAARDALDQPEWWGDSVVVDPRLLVPILPTTAGGSGSGPPFLGPGEELAWPTRPAELDFELEIACILGRSGRDLSTEEAGSAIFGYTVVNDWAAVDPEDGSDGLWVGASFGPCVVTADDFDPSSARLTARVDGEIWSEGSLAAARSTFPELVAHTSHQRELQPGDIVGSGTYPGGRGRDVGRRLHPGALVEVEVTGIGILRTRISPLAA